MYRRLLYIPAILLTLLLASCNSCSDSKKNGQSNTEGEKGINAEVEELDETPDSALAVFLVKHTGDSLYVKIRETGEIRAYAYQEAMSDGDFHGTVRDWDPYSILPDNKYKRVLVAINTRQLSKKWIYDQQNQRGIKFNDKGGVESINAKDICFKEWKLLNGKFYLYTIDQQAVTHDRHQYDVDEAKIKGLDDTHLVLEFKGDTYNCQLPSAKPLKFHP